jgi:hypothetical protein
LSSHEFERRFVRPFFRRFLQYRMQRHGRQSGIPADAAG